MLKLIAVIALFLLTSSKLYAALIYADDYSVGEDATHLTDKATLSWLSGTGNSSSSSVFGPVGFYHQHFGGTTSAATYDTFPGLWNEAHGSPNFQQYQALEINFSRPVQSFGFRAENHTSSPFGVYLYDVEGNFLQLINAYVMNTGIKAPGPVDTGWIWDATYNWNFNFDVGKIRIGGASDAGYIYALDITQVPEPSPLFLLLIGLACVFKVRRAVVEAG